MRHDALYKYPCARAATRRSSTRTSCRPARFRGFGNPSADWAVEQCWDLAAEKLGIDVVDLLRMNAVEPGDVSPHNHKITSCELKQCIDKAAHMIGWKEKRRHRKPNRGLGMGCSVHVNGRRSFGDWDGSSAIVRINDDGRATIITGEGEIGQGTLTVLRQIAAEELGSPYDDVDITRPDTDVHPYALGALASRVTYVAGNAVKRAAAAALKQLLAAASAQFNLPARRTHRHQWRDRSAARARNRIQTGQRRCARAHLSAGRPADHRRRQLGTIRPNFRITAATATNRARTTSRHKPSKSKSIRGPAK